MRALIPLFLLLGSCANSGPPSDSGVAGTVTIGPSCPVIREGEPCPDKPFATDLRVLRDGAVVETIRSGDDGRFRVSLAPGAYTIEAPDRRGPPSAGPVEVIVRAGEFTRIDISFDSGIR